MKLDRTFYLNENVVQLAKTFIGKLLGYNFNGFITSGIITETEAYSNINDKACHANNHKKTNRNANMFLNGGHAYVYLCYGIHPLFNIVTNKENIPDAILIRAIKPYMGIEKMKERKNITNIEKKNIAEGPGNITKLLGITCNHNGIDLLKEQIWVEDIGFEYDKSKLSIGPRIGVDYAGEDALLPYRFKIENKEINL